MPTPRAILGYKGGVPVLQASRPGYNVLDDLDPDQYAYNSLDGQRLAVVEEATFVVDGGGGLYEYYWTGDYGGRPITWTSCRSLTGGYSGLNNLASADIQNSSICQEYYLRHKWLNTSSGTPNIDRIAGLRFETLSNRIRVRNFWDDDCQVVLRLLKGR